MVLFSLDYVARAVSASASGGDGLMRYVFSFYGLVDLMSVLPFFLELPVYGGLSTVSPKLIPTLVRGQSRRVFGGVSFFGGGVLWSDRRSERPEGGGACAGSSHVTRFDVTVSPP